MDETQIVERLKQNQPQPEEFTPAPPVPPTPAETGVAKVADHIDLDEITLYKLHDYFGQRYKDTDEVSKQQAHYIFNAVAERIGNTEYSMVLSHVRDLERIIGTAHRDNRMYRLYEWLKLDGMRSSIEKQMQAVGDAV